MVHGQVANARTLVRWYKKQTNININFTSTSLLMKNISLINFALIYQLLICEDSVMTITACQSLLLQYICDLHCSAISNSNMPAYRMVIGFHPKTFQQCCGMTDVQCLPIQYKPSKPIRDDYHGS